MKQNQKNTNGHETGKWKLKKRFPIFIFFRTSPLSILMHFCTPSAMRHVDIHMWSVKILKLFKATNNVDTYILNKLKHLKLIQEKVK